MQHHAIVTHRPALLGGRKIHGRQVGADRHGGLLPGLAGIIGIENVATLTDGDQALPGTRQVQQRATRRQGTRLGRLIQYVDVTGRLRHTLHQRQQHAQRQQRTLVE
ncbi:hypothetical protein D3C72_1935080 [compost metagenome]